MNSEPGSTTTASHEQRTSLRPGGTQQPDACACFFFPLCRRCVRVRQKMLLTQSKWFNNSCEDDKGEGEERGRTEGRHGGGEGCQVQSREVQSPVLWLLGCTLLWVKETHTHRDAKTHTGSISLTNTSLSKGNKTVSQETNSTSVCVCVCVLAVSRELSSSGLKSLPWQQPYNQSRRW